MIDKFSVRKQSEGVPLQDPAVLIHVEILSNCLTCDIEISEHFKVRMKVINFLVAKPLNKLLLNVFLQEVCPTFRIHPSHRRTLVKRRQSIFTGLGTF
jgi:hypothetical protein